MLPGAATHPHEDLMRQAQRAACLDLIQRIETNLPTADIILNAPDLAWLTYPDVIRITDPPTETFHFGQRLADIIEQYEFERVVYFGGGSAPLLDDQIMGMLADLLLNAGHLARIPSHIVLTNNRHSSDWVAISHVREALPIIRAQDRDNSIAWALQESGEYAVRVLSGIRPATYMDIDTPADLALVRLHPNCGQHLRQATQSEIFDAIPVPAVIAALRQPGSQIALIGRVSPLAWGALNKVTRSWIRVYSEERGMVASGRLANGQVKSMLGILLQQVGPQAFFETLSTLCDAAIIDSRVLMAHQQQGLPAAAERFASDLFDVDAIADEWLREFTIAAANAPIPILLGGHSVVAGGLYVLAELIE